MGDTSYVWSPSCLRQVHKASPLGGGGGPCCSQSILILWYSTHQTASHHLPGTQQKAEKAQREAAKAAEDAKYGKAVAGFVSERARAQLEEYRLKQEAQKQRAEALRQKIITGPFR